MPTESDLLAAVLANPDDDTPRLIYSDWLEEQGGVVGQARAELIRVQCAIEASPHAPIPQYPGCCDDCCRLRRRERDLIPVRGFWDWLVWFEFRRGFVHRLTCTAADWLAHAAAILAAQPIREVALTTWPEIQTREVLHSRCLEFRLNAARLQITRRDLDAMHNPRTIITHVTDQLLGVLWPGIDFDLSDASYPCWDIWPRKRTGHLKPSINYKP